ncbi:MAG: hypothetical protein HWE30_11535 [Methylocystaceae bacterium]|nr:hypothetical protein [Methylocystaceae bacterium]
MNNLKFYLTVLILICITLAHEVSACTKLEEDRSPMLHGLFLLKDAQINGNMFQAEFFLNASLEIHKQGISKILNLLKKFQSLYP